MSHQFSIAPSADIQRSSFDRSHGYKTTIDAGYLVPIFLDEALPGDTFTVNPTLLARLNTPIYPLIDNLFLDIHFFSVPMRQLWSNFRKFMGEQANPDDSVDYTIPMITAGSYAENSLEDYLGLPTGAAGYEHSALPLRAYNHIYNEWYRDQNLIDSLEVQLTDADTATYTLQKRGKRHDYFTSCLPWTQRSPDGEVSISLAGEAITKLKGGQTSTTVGITGENSGSIHRVYTNAAYATLEATTVTPYLFADLSSADAISINALREAIQIQRLQERDARSGSRYPEIIKSHFGVNFMDVTYRPEFLGGTSSPVQINQVPTTTDGTRVVGDLGAYGMCVVRGGGFTKSFFEHSIIMGIASVRADLTYQQGLDRLWSRETRYDFYWPVFSGLGEQAVLNKEIYCQGTAGGTDDDDVFGYQERYAEYRYKPSKITGTLRSSASTPLDAWHLSQEFGALPTLSQTFIEETPPMDRVVAVTSEPDFLLDCYFNMRCARPMPMYSIPGMMDHF